MHLILITAFLSYLVKERRSSGIISVGWEFILHELLPETFSVSFPLSGPKFIPAHPAGKNDCWS